MSDIVPTQDDMLKIIRINAYIQRGMGKVTLDGEVVMVVALDRSWAGTESYDPERFLTDEQLNDLFIQSFGYTKNSKNGTERHVEAEQISEIRSKGM